MPLVARMFASSEHAWDPMASSSATHVRLKRTCMGSNGILECKFLSKNAHRTSIPALPSTVAMGRWMLEREEHRTSIPVLPCTVAMGGWLLEREEYRTGATAVPSMRPVRTAQCGMGPPPTSS
jgi:hypothetical protein